MTDVPEVVDYASVSLEEAGPPHTVGFSDARRALPALIKQVADTGVRAVITRYDKPAVAVVPLADLRKLEAWEKDKAEQLSFTNEVDHETLVNFMGALNDDKPADREAKDRVEDCVAVVDSMLASMFAVPEMQSRFQEIAASAIREAAANTAKSAAATNFSAEILGSQLQQNMLAALSTRTTG